MGWRVLGKRIRIPKRTELAGQNEAKNVSWRVAMPSKQQNKITALNNRNNWESERDFDATLSEGILTLFLMAFEWRYYINFV